MSTNTLGEDMPLTRWGITNPETPAQHFAYWLPGELEYSARKAGYHEKIRRAALPTEDPQCMYNFLANEWFQHRTLLNQGVHYLPFHGMSAQLQAAKFAAGLFDKVAIVDWLGTHREATTDEYVFSGRWVAAQRQKGIYNSGDMVALRTDFTEFGDTIEDTPFAEGILQVMEDVTKAARIRDQLNIGGHSAKRYSGAAERLAWLATHYYVSYAHEYLTPEQYELPISELAPQTQLHSSWTE